MWPHIKEYFYITYLEALEYGSLGIDINKVYIQLITKGKHVDYI